MSGNPRWITAAEAGQHELEYSDVTLTPDQLTVAPFYDAELSGPGFPALDAPGEGLIIVPVYIDTFVSQTGDPWGLSPSAKLYYDNPQSGEGAFSDGSNLAEITDSLTEPVCPYPIRTYGNNSGGGYFYIVGAHSVDTVINKGMVLATINDASSGGTGTYSIRYRIYYQVVQWLDP